MRRGLVLICFALLIGGVIGSVAVLDAGYVRLEFFGWVVESNVIVAVSALLLAYFVLRLLLRLLSVLVGTGASFARLRTRFKHGRALAQARAGILEFAAGNWQQAAEALGKAAVGSAEPLTIWLNAAAAARKAGDAESMRQAISEARRLTGDAPELTLMEARWHIEDGDAPQAVRMLRELDDAGSARNAAGKQLLLAKAFHDLQDWESLKGAIKTLEKSKAIPPDAYRALEIAQAQASLDSVEAEAKSTGIAPVTKDVHAAWKRVPNHLRNEPQLVRRKMELQQIDDKTLPSARCAWL